MQKDAKPEISDRAGGANSARILVLYDGLCGLCDRVIRFVALHDSHDAFRFAPQQSRLGQEILGRHEIPAAQTETIRVVLNHREPSERLLTKSGAAIAIASRLGGGWRLATALRILPRWLRDGGYDFIARNRYRVFGKFDACRLPDASVRHKFPED